jgi:hypothetical protein
MKRKPNYHKQIVSLLEELMKTYPEYNLGRHLSTALDGYGDVWGLTDKEFVFLLSKYKTRMELDIPHVTDDDEELDKIVREGMDLDSLFKEEEDNGDNY